ncbi:MAG: glutamine amidotransferase [bacterium]|nr:MAG: glutamine amidotransferase [bacterium]
MILFIDNYDSFTYNLVQYIGEQDSDLQVFRNDQITLEEIEKLSPKGIVISPGPCTPKEAGLSVDIIKHFYKRIPIFGVCLGHQSIGYAFGAEVVGAKDIVHGKTSEIRHNGKTLFTGLEDPFTATRYHSLILNRDTIPNCFEITCWIEDNTVMGIRHKDYPLEGVQFHPESILTQVGKKIIANFLTSL